MNNTIKDLEKEFKKTELITLLNSFLNVAIENKYSLAFYRLPQTIEIIAIVSFSKNESMVPLETTSDKTGFIVSPFLSEDNNVHFITSDLIIHFNSFKVLSSTSRHSEANTFIEQALTFNNVATAKNTDVENSSVKENYVEVTSTAIDKIKKEEFKKVVLARKKTLDFRHSPIDLFLSLNKEQQDSFISLVAIPEKNIWVGASPELLVSIDNNNIFRTVALAGTQKALPCSEASVVWTQKEIEEQALVIRYIISCFKKIRIREYDEVGPKTVKSGNVFHLKTDFSVNLNEVHYPNLGHVMLELLHPTSAVCGTPKEEALNFIKSFEGLDRKFYSGYLGPVNIDQETHVFVNIRCAEIIDNKVNLYSGAGITSESDPEKELQETSLKMQLIENLLSNKRGE